MKGIQFFLFLGTLCLFGYFFHQKYENNHFSNEKVDLVVFSYHRPLQLYAFLESLHIYGQNYGHVFVLYRSEKSRFDRAYQDLKSTFKKVQFIKQSNINPAKQFKQEVMDLAFNPVRSRSKYICFAVDDIVIKKPIDFVDAIHGLNTSGAYGFFLRLGKEISDCYMLQLQHVIPPLTLLEDKYLLFTFEKGNGDWNYPNNLDMTIYRKQDIYPDLKRISFTYPNDLEAVWSEYRENKKKGVCYQNAKIINLPLNVISKANNRNMQAYSIEELLISFEQGYKFDLSDIGKIHNRSVHFEYIPKMVSR